MFTVRKKYLNLISFQLKIHPICAILGPRQVGKTTLARQYVEQYFSDDAYFFDLENPKDLARLENPLLTLQSITQKLIVLDEIQLKPDLFPILRVFVDETRTKAHQSKKKEKLFLILGSASRDLIRQSSETLAGRIGYIELPPFSLFEAENSDKLLIRGGFPRSYLARSESDSFDWRRSYIQTFLERDLAAMGFDITPQAMG